MQCFGESEVELIINKGRAFIFEDVLVTNFLSPHSNFPSCTWKCISTIFFKTGICFYVFFFLCHSCQFGRLLSSQAHLIGHASLPQRLVPYSCKSPKAQKNFHWSTAGHHNGLQKKNFKQQTGPGGPQRPTQWTTTQGNAMGDAMNLPHPPKYREGRLLRVAHGNHVSTAVTDCCNSVQLFS